MSICLLSKLQNVSLQPAPPASKNGFKERWQIMSAQPELSLAVVNQQRRNKYVFNVEIFKKCLPGQKNFDTLPLSHACLSWAAVLRDIQRIWFTLAPLPGEFINLAPCPPAGNHARKHKKIPGAVFPWCHIWMAFPDCNAKQTQIYYCTFQKHSPPGLAALIFFFSRSEISCITNSSRTLPFSFSGSALPPSMALAEMIFTHQLAEGPTQAVNKQLANGNCGIIPPFPPEWGSQPN